MTTRDSSFSSVSAKTGTQTVTITAGEEVTTTVEITVSESTVSEVRNTANMVGAEDNSTGFHGASSDIFNVPVGKTKYIAFTNYSDLADNWNNFLVFLHKSITTDEYAFVRADNFGLGNGYAACVNGGTQGDWSTWLSGMNGAKVTVYVTNCGNSTADIQAVMVGTKGTTSTQYYLGINTIDPNDLCFTLSVEKAHLVFNE